MDKAGAHTPKPGARGSGGQAVHFHFDGRELAATDGMTVAGALVSNGERAWRATRAGAERRGLFCGIGTCFDCLVDVNSDTAVRACLRAVRDGDDVRSSGSVGAPGVAGERNDSEEAADVAVVGAGPAGMAAASAAAARGARVVLVDAGARLGGQFFRQSLVDESDGLPARFRDLAADPLVRLWLGREVWSATKEGAGFALRLDGGALVRARAVVLATGASELALPFPGWELPGVVTAGAAQALLKSQGVAIGRRVVVAGTGPFLLPVAVALAKAGSEVTVVEAASARAGPRALAALVTHPGRLAEAAAYGRELTSYGVKVFTGRAVVRCEGSGHVERAVLARLGPGWAPMAGSEQMVGADFVCVSAGFVPRVELARQLGASDLVRPDRLSGGIAGDATMQSTTPGLFVAGELAGIGGALVAELEGEVAGHAAASYVGLADGRRQTERDVLGQRLGRGRSFAARLEAVYPLGAGWASWLEGSTVFCRCEEVTWAAVRAAVAQGAQSAREVRGLTRCGMGYCQGRTCGPPLQLAVAALTGRPVDRVGDLQKRPVAVPVFLGEVAR